MLFRILFFLLIGTSGYAQYQPMNYTHYSFPNNVNIGTGVLRITNSSAYLEVGRDSGSKKGLLIPRGSKDSVATPSKGLLFYDLPTNHVWYYNGSAWIDFGSGGGVGTLQTVTDLGASTTNNISINSASGVALAVTAPGSTPATTIQSNGSTGNAYGLKIFAGTNSTDYALRLADKTGGNNLALFHGDGNIKFPQLYNSSGVSGTGFLKIGTGGALSVDTSNSGGINENLANADLSFTGNRYHNARGYRVAIDSTKSFWIKGNPSESYDSLFWLGKLTDADLPALKIGAYGSTSGAWTNWVLNSDKETDPMGIIIQDKNQQDIFYMDIIQSGTPRTRFAFLSPIETHSEIGFEAPNSGNGYITGYNNGDGSSYKLYFPNEEVDTIAGKDWVRSLGLGGGGSQDLATTTAIGNSTPDTIRAAGFSSRNGYDNGSFNITTNNVDGATWKIWNEGFNIKNGNVENPALVQNSIQGEVMYPNSPGDTLNEYHLTMAGRYGANSKRTMMNTYRTVTGESQWGFSAGQFVLSNNANGFINPAFSFYPINGTFNFNSDGSTSRMSLGSNALTLEDNALYVIDSSSTNYASINLKNNSGNVWSFQNRGSAAGDGNSLYLMYNGGAKTIIQTDGKVNTPSLIINPTGSNSASTTLYSNGIFRFDNNCDVNGNYVMYQASTNSYPLRIENTGEVAINGSGITSAQLAVNSTTKGFLAPRMTRSQWAAIGSPAQGLLAYDTGHDKFIYSNGSVTKVLLDSAGAMQTFATGTSGTDFNISSSGTTHTFNIPSASATNRGLITTGTQTIAGNKTFSGDIAAAFVGSTSAMRIGTVGSGSVDLFAPGGSGSWSQTFAAEDGTVATREWVGTQGYTTATNTQTLMNKRITSRIGTTASASTITPNGDSHDQYNVTSLATDPTVAAPSGTPTDGQSLLLRIKDDGTSRTITWNSIYRASTDFALPTTTTISKTMYLQFIYNAADSKWDAVGLTKGF